MRAKGDALKSKDEVVKVWDYLKRDLDQRLHSSGGESDSTTSPIHRNRRNSSTSSTHEDGYGESNADGLSGPTRSRRECVDTGVGEGSSQFSRAENRRAYASSSKENLTKLSETNGLDADLVHQFSSLSIGQIKSRLRKLRVDSSTCVEKQELIYLLVTEQMAENKRQEKMRLEKREEEEKEKMTERVVNEVQLWARGKSLKRMLNEVNGVRPGDSVFLNRVASFSAISKAYKRAILKIHPDKHMGDHEKFVRATEMFKEVNEKWVAVQSQQ